MDSEPQQWVGGPTENMSDEKEAVTRPLGILEEKQRKNRFFSALQPAEPAIQKTEKLSSLATPAK